MLPPWSVCQLFCWPYLSLHHLGVHLLLVSTSIPLSRTWVWWTHSTYTVSCTSSRATLYSPYVSHFPETLFCSYYSYLDIWHLIPANLERGSYIFRAPLVSYNFITPLYVLSWLRLPPLSSFVCAVCGQNVHVSFCGSLLSRSWVRAKVLQQSSKSYTCSYHLGLGRNHVSTVGLVLSKTTWLSHGICHAWGLSKWSNAHAPIRDSGSS